jgi:transposase InsO family protein
VALANSRPLLAIRLNSSALIERWRQHYNRFRPHSALGYRPPAPEAIEFSPPGFAPLRLAAAHAVT